MKRDTKIYSATDESGYSSRFHRQICLSDRVAAFDAGLGRSCRHEEIQYFPDGDGRYNPSLDFMVRVAASMGKQVTITIEDE